MSTRKIPRTDSIHELATFWDTHDLTDYQHELQEIAEPVFVRCPSIEVQLQSSEIEVVWQIAHSKGISQGELIRELVLQEIARWRRREQTQPHR